MEVVASLLSFVLFIVGMFCKILTWLLVIRILLSWVGVNPYTQSNDLLTAIYQVTDFILAPFRRLPLQVGMFDLSPMVAMALLYYLPDLLGALISLLLRLLS